MANPVGGETSNILGIFTPDLWGNDSQFDGNIIQMGGSTIR